METATPQFMQATQRSSSASISQAEVSRSNSCLVRHGKQISWLGRQISDSHGSYQTQIKSTTSARLSHSQCHAQKGNCQITQLESGLPDWPFCGQISEIWPCFKLVGHMIFGLAVFRRSFGRNFFLLAVFENMSILVPCVCVSPCVVHYKWKRGRMSVQLCLPRCADLASQAVVRNSVVNWYIYIYTKFQNFGIFSKCLTYKLLICYMENLVYFCRRVYLRLYTKLFILLQSMNREITVMLKLYVKSLMILLNMGVSG